MSEHNSPEELAAGLRTNSRLGVEEEGGRGSSR